jgi:hypothetical protein
MEEAENTITEVIERILELKNPYRRLDVAKDGQPGQFVVTGPQMGGGLFKRVGYCVQVRKHCGQYRSDMVFLRHHDGKLTTHENQFFYAMTAEQEALARSIFDVLPEDEDYTLGFSTDGVHEVGFVIENSATPASPTTPTTVVLTEKLADGTERKSITTFI